MILHGATDEHDLRVDAQTLNTASLRAPGVLTPMRYRQYVGFATSILRDTEEAKDAVQTSLRKALEHEDTFRGSAKFQSWLITIIINECRRRLRRAGRWRMMPIDQSEVGVRVNNSRDNPERDLASKELCQLIGREVHLIRKVYRDVVILRDFEGRELDEIGCSLGLSLSAVKSRLLRGRNELRGRLECRGVTAHLLASRPAMI